MKKIWLAIIAIVALTGCSNQKSNFNASSYDGDYYSYSATIENTNDILFTIKNGYITGKISSGTIDEKNMSILDSENQKSSFIYDKGEMIIKSSKNIKAYRKNSPAYKYINEIYGKYNRVLEPRLIEIIEQNYLQFLNGSYTSQSPDLDVSKILINNNQLSIQYRNSVTKQLKFVLKNITISEPNWDKDQNIIVDEKLLQDYEKCSTIEDIMAISDFDLKLTGEDDKKQNYNIMISYKHGSRKIMIQKQNDSKNNWIDSYYDFSH